MTNQNYLSRLQEKKLNKEIKDCAMFGIFTGGIIFLISGWYKLFTTVGHITLFNCLLTISGLMFICGVIIPQILYYPQKFLLTIGNFLFEILFKLLLLLVYIFIVIPTGLIYEKKIPICYKTWDNKENLETEKWTEKTFDYSLANGSHAHKNFMFSCLNVLKFFITKKQMFLIPAIIAILILGIIFSFIQSSLIAPFIYTLF